MRDELFPNIIIVEKGRDIKLKRKIPLV